MYLKIKISLWDDPFGNISNNFCYLNICNNNVYGFYVCERNNKYDVFIKDKSNGIKLELASYSSMGTASKALEWLIKAINTVPNDCVLEMPQEEDIVL